MKGHLEPRPGPDAADNSTDFQNAFVPQSMGLGRSTADPTGVPLGFDSNSEREPAVWDQRHPIRGRDPAPRSCGVRLKADTTYGPNPYTGLEIFWRRQVAKSATSLS